jgi:bifunctional non-homologous end joining protein LigD
VASVTPSSVQLFSRHGKNWTASFPELADLTRLGVSAVLDGELAVLNPDGRADFDLLGRRLVARAGISTLSQTHPARLFAFDVIELNGRNLCSEPWTERRRLLEDLDLARADEAIRLVPYSFDGPAMHAETERLHFEGTVAKRCRSRYFPNTRSRAWQKIKHRKTAVFAVMGWRPSTSRHPGGLVVTDAEGQPVGMAMLFLSKPDEERLLEMMHRHGRSHGGMLAVPEGSLVAEVTFSERTARGTLREAVCRRVQAAT